MTDVSAQAVRSARATVDLNNVGDRVSVRWMDALSQLPDHSADLVVCNPPFHDGTAVTTTPAHRIFADVGRVLTPGGRMLTVFNTPLAYAPTLRRLVGPTRVLATHAKFTITESVTPGQGPHSSA
jgi:16S rRNA (guanine1207-N2)-methyltransferase